MPSRSAGWGVYHRYWYYLPGLIASIRDPVGPNVAVHWQTDSTAAPAPSASRPPNIVVILADDLGWNDLTFNGGGVAGGAVPTPQIDSIARDGMLFTQAYAGNATCAPSRAAIMTGRYATRFGFEFTPAPIAFSKLIGTYHAENGQPMIYHAELENDYPSSIDELTVPTSETMIGQLMKTKGYHTIMLGKWHLGGTPTTRPEARGFDEALAFYAGASMYLPKRSANVENSHAGFRSDRQIPVGQPAVRRALQRLKAVRACGIHDRLSRQASRRTRSKPTRTGRSSCILPSTRRTRRYRR